MVFIGARRRPKEKDNEAFAKGVDPAVRSGRHIRLGCCPQSSRSGRRTDSVVPTQERLELLSNLVPHTFQQIALTSKVTKVTLSNRGARIDSFRGRPIAGPHFCPNPFRRETFIGGWALPMLHAYQSLVETFPLPSHLPCPDCL